MSKKRRYTVWVKADLAVEVSAKNKGEAEQLARKDIGFGTSGDIYNYQIERVTLGGEDA